jgi:hypothetical protein
LCRGFVVFFPRPGEVRDGVNGGVRAIRRDATCSVNQAKGRNTPPTAGGLNVERSFPILLEVRVKRDCEGGGGQRNLELGRTPFGSYAMILPVVCIAAGFGMLILYSGTDALGETFTRWLNLWKYLMGFAPYITVLVVPFLFVAASEVMIDIVGNTEGFFYLRLGIMAMVLAYNVYQLQKKVIYRRILTASIRWRLYLIWYASSISWFVYLGFAHELPRV